MASSIMRCRAPDFWNRAPPTSLPDCGKASSSASVAKSGVRSHFAKTRHHVRSGSGGAGPAGWNAGQPWRVSARASSSPTSASGHPMAMVSDAAWVFAISATAIAAWWRGSLATWTRSSGHGSSRSDHAASGMPQAEKFEASLSGAAIRLVMGRTSCSMAAATTGGKSGTPAKRMRRVDSAVGRISENGRVRSRRPQLWRRLSMARSRVARACQRSDSTVSARRLAAVARVCPFSWSSRRKAASSRARPAAQRSSSLSGSGMMAWYGSHDSMTSSSEIHASSSSQFSAMPGASSPRRIMPGVMVFGESTAPPQASASISRKRRPLCAVGTTTRVSLQSAPRAAIHSTARGKNG